MKPTYRQKLFEVVKMTKLKNKIPLKTRIKDSLIKSGGVINYHALMVECFPFDEYQKAWRYQSRGGPPACAMAFGKALRELGCIRTGSGAGGKVHMPDGWLYQATDKGRKALGLLK